jgi:uncharacterized protein YjbI with pentapeptide repeats
MPDKNPSKKTSILYMLLHRKPHSLAGKNVQLVILLSVIFLLILACSAPYTTYYNSRAVPVNPDPFWDCDISPDVQIPNVNLVQKAKTHSFSDPNPQISRYKLIPDASSAFNQLCENGLSFYDNQHVAPGDLIYSGEDDLRYCASEGNENSNEFGSRFHQYHSYTVLQRKEIVVLIYEFEKEKGDIGKLTNQEITRLCANIQESARADPKDQLERELTLNGAVGRDLREMDLSNMNLSGLDAVILADEDTLRYLPMMEQPDFSEANMSGADLSSSILVQMNLAGANFSNANLQGVDMRFSLAAQTILENADLRNANLTHTSFGQARFHQAILDETTQIDDKWRLVWFLVNYGAEGLDLRGVNLSAANLSGIDLSAADLSGADLTYANLINVNLSNVNLTNANLKGAVFTTEGLPEMYTFDDLAGDDVSPAILSAAVLNNADLSEAYISEDQLQQTASLQGAILPEGTTR